MWRSLLRGREQAQERGPLWLEKWCLLRHPQRRLERRPERVKKRGLFKVEDSRLLRTLLRPDGRRLLRRVEEGR